MAAKTGYMVLAHDAGTWGFTVRYRKGEAPALYCRGEFFASGQMPDASTTAEQIAANLMNFGTAWANRVKLQRWDGGKASS